MRTRLRGTGRRDRGVSLVGYALVLSLFVVGSVPAIDYLNDESADEVANQSSCISQRPPPIECLRRAGDPEYTPADEDAPPDPDAEGPIDIPPDVDDLPDDDTPATPNAAFAVDSIETRFIGSSGRWEIEINLLLGGIPAAAADDDDLDFDDVEVFVSARNIGGVVTAIKTVKCKSNDAGRCRLKSRWSAVFSPQVELTFIDIFSPSGLVIELPDPILVDRPVA